MEHKVDNLEKLPIQESMRRSHHKEGYDMKMYDQGRQNYKIVGRYIDRYLKKSIGKNYDKIKKHILERLKDNNTARYENNLVDSLLSCKVGDDCKYVIDSQNRIQLNEKYAERCKGWRERRISKKTTLIDNSKHKTYKLKPDISEGEVEEIKNRLIDNGSYNKTLFIHVTNGGLISESKLREFLANIKYDYTVKDKWGYTDYITETRDFVESCFIVAEDNVVHVFDEKSPEYRQYKKECQDKKHKEDRERKKIQEEYNDNILFYLEYNRKKKEQDKDAIDRDRLGFDEKSFKGEPYHGQKRKKKLTI